MNFVSLAELHHDIAQWERQLPDFDAVCGVPRSGLIPAVYIALRRNIRLVELSDLLRQPEGAIGRAMLRDTNPSIHRPLGNRLLIVDDSVSNASATLRDLRQRLASQRSLEISYGAVYRASAASQTDYHYREIPMPRMFEWNWYRNWWLQSAMLDMDGVICEDWKHRPEQDQDPEFERHVTEARPLFVPQIPIRAVVTSRIERYRAGTEAWLRRHGVRYGALIMHPARTPEERRRWNDHAVRKAAAYRDDPDAKLFIESDARQAEQIYSRTGKPVLCTDTMLSLQA
jgi:orotate phosphoribosyltransferase